MQPHAQEPEHLEQSLNALLEEVRSNTERVTQARWQLDRQEITGHATNGEVTARLVGSGRFTGIDIAPETLRRYDPDTVGSLVLEAVNDGLRKLEQASRVAFAPFVADTGGDLR